MKITRRSPSIKIGDTRYTFTKNGINKSERLFGKLRLHTKANGKRYLFYSCFGLNFRQDLKKIDYENMSNFSLFFENPFLLFKRLFSKGKQSKTKTSFEVRIYKIVNNTLQQATDGFCVLEDEKITINADVSKSVFYSDITNIFEEKGFVLIFSNGRKNPLILLYENANELISEISKKL